MVTIRGTRVLPSKSCQQRQLERVHTYLHYCNDHFHHKHSYHHQHTYTYYYHYSCSDSCSEPCVHSYYYFCDYYYYYYYYDHRNRWRR